MAQTAAFPQSASEMLLEVRDLHVATTGAGDPVDLVSGANLDARRGEVVGVVGESGSGKSLTLRAVAGLLPKGVSVSSGKIAVDGIDVAKADSKTFHKLRGGVVGMVFQEPMSALNPTMRIGSQIVESACAKGRLSRKEGRDRAIELLGQMGFVDPRRSFRLYPHELSGGMRQRVVIAIALAGNPSLLLCDEPTTALDATVTMKVLDLIVDLGRKLQIGVVVVTHDLGVAARICDRIVVMYAGRMVEEGPAEAVLRRPRHPYTLALLQAVPTLGSTIDALQAIPGAPPSPGEVGQGCPFAARCAFAQEACAQPVHPIPIEGGRMTACRRQELLAAAEGVRSA